MTEEKRQRCTGTSQPEQDNTNKFLLRVENIYSEIKRKIEPINDESEAELGKWVNIISYIVDHSIDNSLSDLQANELMSRTELAVAVILSKPNSSLRFVREIRHEILMDIYRAEPFSKHIIYITNGSPSFTVAFGVATSSLFLLLFIALVYAFPGINLFSFMDRFFSSTNPPSVETAAIAAFWGAVVSMLIRLEQFETRRAVDPKLLYLNAISKPFIGVIISLFVVAVQGIGLYSLATITGPSDQKFSLFLIVVGFLAGFSERFAGDIIGGVEGSLGTNRTSGRRQGTYP